MLEQLEAATAALKGPPTGQDLVVDLMQLLARASFATESDRATAQKSIEQVSSMLGLKQLPAQSVPVTPPDAGGLAHWQAVRLRGYIDSKIDQKIPISALSELVRLSNSHFARAFKKTFGETPHSFVLQQRIVHAKRLLGTTDIPLHEVALSCSFADQSHLCRVFLKFTGQTPAKWRKSWGRLHPRG